MSKFFRFFILVSLFFTSNLLIAQDDPISIPSNQVTFEYLSSSPWTNHVIFFDQIFKKLPPNTILEFGLGNSTKFFLENARNVVSLELNAACTSHQTEGWFYSCKNKFNTFSNWTPILHNCSDLISLLTELAWKGIKSSSLPENFFLEISQICEKGLNLCNNDCSLAFVDSALFGRAYLVTELLKRNIPIVAAHDTDLGVHFYAWDTIITPSNYVLIQFKASNTNQLSVWFLKDLLSSADIDELQKLNE